MRLALAQLNVVVGDLEGNRAKILDAARDGERRGGPTSSSSRSSRSPGTRPRICSSDPGFVRAARESLEEIAAAANGIVALVGTPWFDRDLANACAVCADGRVQAVYRKHFLPNYGVFDEHRYFAEGRGLVLLRIGRNAASG